MICIHGAARGSRCTEQAVDGFAYCQKHGLALGERWLNCGFDYAERDRMNAERLADEMAAQCGRKR